MKTNNQLQALLMGTTILGAMFAATNSPATNILQTVTEGTGVSWTAASWGTPAAVATNGGNYETPNSSFTVRTPGVNLSGYSTNFPGSSLQIDAGGILYLKHGGNATNSANVNLILNGGAMTYHGGFPPAVPVGGTLQVSANSTINSDQNGGSGTPGADIWLLSPISGSGNITVNMDTTTNSLILFGTNTSYTGNWTNTLGLLQVASGSSNALGSGSVTLTAASTALVFNSSNSMVVTNLITGNGGVLMENTGSVTLTANNTYSNALNIGGGLLTLTGTGAQATTAINSNGILRVANSGAIRSGSTLTINPNNAQTGGLQLSNNLTIATGNTISVAQRTGTTVAIESLSGNNAISDAISIYSGGTSPVAIQSDAGSTLALNNGVTCSVTGSRGVLLEGAGNGSITGGIANGSATSVSVTKDGAGTWSINGANSYTGNTVVTNGVLQFGSGSFVSGSPVVEVDTGAKLDVSVPGLALGSSQLLRGGGSVLGNVTTSSGTVIQVGLTNTYGQQLSLSNNLGLAGGETIEYNFSTSGANNVLNVAGSLTLGGSTTIQIFLPTGVASNGTFRLINYSGTLQGGGSFTLVAPATVQMFTLSTSTPGQVNLIVTGTPQNLVWSGDGSGNTWDVATTANWNSQTTTFNQGDTVTFNDSGSAVPDINVASTVMPSSMTISNTAEAYTFDGSGITTSGSLVKLGGNTVSFTSSGNAFSGPISIQAGTLSVGNGGTSGSLGTGPITNNGQLVFNNSAITYNQNNAISGSGSLQLTGGGVILNLSGSNSYTGGTTVGNNCAVSILNNSALGATNTGTVVQSGGRVGFTALGNWTVNQPLSISGYGLSSAPGALYANTISNVATWTGPITVAGPAQIRLVNNYVTMNLANAVVGSGQTLECSTVNTGDLLNFQNTFSIGNDPVLAALTKDGVGTMILGGSSNLCGSTTINAGTLEITSTNTPNLGAVTVNTGTLQIGDGGADGALPNAMVNLAGSGTLMYINSSNSMNLSNGLTGAGALSKLGTGTLTIPTSNSFTGGATFGSASGTGTNGGYVNLQNSFGLGDGSVAETVTIVRAELQLQGNLDIPSNITFQTSGNSILPNYGAGWGLLPIHSLSGSNSIEGNITLIGGANGTEISVAAGRLTLNGNVTPNVSNRPLVLSGAGAGILNGSFNDGGLVPAATLIKQGSGSWTLNNANNYAGATTNQGGTLILGAGASIPNTPVIQLLSNAVLDVTAVSGGFTLGSSQALQGIGSVHGSFNAAGTVAPGPLGTLSFNNSLVLSGTTVMELNRTNAQNADLITAASITMGGTLTVTNVGGALQPGDTFTLFAGALGGSFAATNLPVLSSNSWDTSRLASQGILKVASTAAPTPIISAPTDNGTHFTLQVNSSSVGFNYVMQATPSLVPPITWTNIQTNAGNGGTLNFSFPIPANTPEQYFRISVH